MRKVTLRELEHFVALAEHGSVTGAARAIGLSQPAMSTSLQELEKALEVTLFVRHRGRGLGLARRSADRGPAVLDAFTEFARSSLRFPRQLGAELGEQIILIQSINSIPLTDAPMSDSIRGCLRPPPLRSLMWWAYWVS